MGGGLLQAARAAELEEAEGEVTKSLAEAEDERGQAKALAAALSESKKTLLEEHATLKKELL
eukprot:3856713-Pyramimonas_sp.AAC.1